MDTKKLRQKILDLAIRGKLVPQDPNDESASVLLERIRAEKERLIAEGKIKRPKKSKASSAESHYQNFTPPFEAPAYWGWCKIDDVAFVTKLAGFEYSKYIADNLSSEFGIPLFKGKNVKNGAIDYTFESFIPEPISDELWRSQITKKCLLTPYVGAIGNVGIHHKTGKFHLGSNVGKIEIFNEHESLYSEEYLRYYLLSTYGYKELTKHKKATAQESISIDAIRDVIIPVVGIDEQFRIVSEIEKWGKFLDNIDNGILQLTDYISLAKSKILDLAMQGKLVPQDPTDEPAADMLRRINPKAKIITDNPHYPQLPSEWCIAAIGDVFEINPKNVADGDTEAGFVPMASICDGFNNSFVYIRRKWDEIKTGFTHFANGDIAVAKISPCLENRKSMILKNLPNGIGSGTTELLVFRSKIVYPEYGLLFFKSDNFIKQCVGTFNGVVGQQRVGKSIVEEILIPIPPLNMQRTIVRLLNEWFDKLDNILVNLSN